MRVAGLFFGLTLIAGTLHAGSKTGADFLKIPVGAHGAALGQAYTAEANGIDAMNWNPAGLASSPRYLTRNGYGLSLTHQQHLAESSFDHLGFALSPNATRATAWGFNIVRLTYGDQEGRDEFRNKTGDFKAADMALGLTAARRFGSSLMGAQFKLIQQKYAGLSARGYAVDLGLQTAGPIEKMDLGFSVRNLGPQMKFIDEAYSLPLTLSAGTSYRVAGPLALLLDVHMRPKQKQTVVSAGAEFAAARMVSLRAGYLAQLADAVVNKQQSETEFDTLGGVYGLAAGMGLHFGQFAMDYAITPFGELGNTQTLTLASWFGGAEKPVKGTDGTEAAPVSIDIPERRILIIPMDHENWWNDLH